MKSLKANSQKSPIRSHGAHFLRGRNFCSLIRSKSTEATQKKLIKITRVNVNKIQQTTANKPSILHKKRPPQSFFNPLPPPPTHRAPAARFPVNLNFQNFIKPRFTGLLYDFKIRKKPQRVPRSLTEIVSNFGTFVPGEF